MNTLTPDPRAKAQQDVRDVRKQITRLDRDSLNLLLSGARTHYAWQDRPVSDEIIREIVKLTLDGPTSMNGSPARFVIVRSPEAKDRLAKALKPLNVPKMRAAPVTVIVAYDLEFWKHLLRLFPHDDRRHLFENKPEYAAETAFRNGTLQGAYFMIAARALGLDVGALSGF
ncbi:malonic semialdehyde reductase, partial [Phaeovulum sp.]|uniref:malonic semialdehyde reductase n=1 Tax=Phaeovulum sp. TaxID=2934796 RepID=UPI003563984C